MGQSTDIKEITVLNALCKTLMGGLHDLKEMEPESSADIAMILISLIQDIEDNLSDTSNLNLTALGILYEIRQRYVELIPDFN